MLYICKYFKQIKVIFSCTSDNCEQNFVIIKNISQTRNRYINKLLETSYAIYYNQKSYRLFNSMAIWFLLQTNLTSVNNN